MISLHSGTAFKIILGNDYLGDDFHEDFEVVFMMIVCVIKWFLDLRHPKRLCKNQQITTNMMISRIFFDDFPWKIDQNHGKWRKTWEM